MKTNWNKVKEKLPKNDKAVVAHITGIKGVKATPYLSLCSYLNGKWYCQGGLQSNERVIRWAKIPK